MNKKYKPVIAVAVLVILVAILGIVTHVVMKYIPSSEKMDLNEYYGEMADGEIALVIGTEKLEERGRRQSLFTTGCGEYLSEPEILLGFCQSADTLCNTFGADFCECII